MRRAMILALAVAATLSLGAKQQPVQDIPAGATVVMEAPQPSSVFNAGYHGDCGHGCNWELVQLPVCPADTTQAVVVTNVTGFDTFIKYYWDPRRETPPRGTSAWLTFTPTCKT